MRGGGKEVGGAGDHCSSVCDIMAGTRARLFVAPQL